MPYTIRKLKLGKSEHLDRLALASGDLYSRTVTFFWRTVRKKGIWLSPRALMKIFKVETPIPEPGQGRNRQQNRYETEGVWALAQVETLKSPPTQKDSKPGSRHPAQDHASCRLHPPTGRGADARDRRCAGHPNASGLRQKDQPETPPVDIWGRSSATLLQVGAYRRNGCSSGRTRNVFYVPQVWSEAKTERSELQMWMWILCA